MQKTNYICDHCQVEIGDIKHISLNLGSFSGIANPPKKEKTKRWVVYGCNRFAHFCSTECLKDFFDGWMKKIK